MVWVQTTEIRVSVLNWGKNVCSTNILQEVIFCCKDRISCAGTNYS